MSSSDEEVAVPVRRAKPSAFAMMAMDSDSSSDSDSGSSRASTPPPAKAAAPAPAPKAAAPAPAKAAAKGKGGKAGKGGKGGGDDDDDLDALLAAAIKENAPVEAAPAPAPAPAATAEEADKKKKKKKKDKKAGGAGGGDEEGGSDGEEKPAAAAPAKAEAKPAAKKAAPVSAAMKAAQEQLALRRAAEEKARKEAEEAQRRIDEENARIEAEEKRKAEEKARKKEKERLKKEAAIRDGTYMTKKQKEDLEKARARLGLKVGGEGEVAAAAAAAAAAAEAEAAAAEAEATRKRTAAMYDTRKRDRAAKSGGEAVPSGGDAAAAPAAPPAPAAPAPASAVAVDDWETAADDWEAQAAADAAAEAAAAAAAAAAASSSGGKAKASAPVAAPAPAAYDGPAKSLEERIRESRARREARRAAAVAARDPSRLRSPIAVVLGHVDTGKTSLLDCIRRTNVQEGEAGGITQQIGASYFPMERLRTATDKINKDLNLEYKVPGLLIMDTPGHEQFANLRSRGAGLCDIAVLVIDIMAGLERQTIESIRLLKDRKTPFIVALNKVDRMYGWKANPGAAFRETLATQPEYSVAEFETRAQKVMVQLAEQGLNSALYYKNDDFRRVVSIVPTSAHTGEGVPDLLMLLVQLTQQMMSHRLMFEDDVQCTVLEVKAIDGLGTTIDVVLVNGELKEGDTVVACGMDGPIVTQIRSLLTPPPLREMRVKSEYIHHKRIEAAIGVKIAAQGLEKAVAGTSLLVVHPDDEIEDLKEEAMKDYHAIMKGFQRDPVGVYVQASTLGSLEALLMYLRNHEPPVPVASVGIGPLHKKDVTTCSIMLEHKKEYATILAFDVKITPEARAAADDLGVKIFTADIIYHLTDQFDKYLKDTLEAKQAAMLAEAVFPCIARIIPTAIFMKQDPIVVGMDVIEGKLKLGTPLCVVLPADKKVASIAAAAAASDDGAAKVTNGPNILPIGKVASIEHNHVAVTEAAPGGPSVAVKIVPANDAQRSVLYGRHFDASYPVYSHISRGSINVLKESFRDKMTKADWATVITLKGKLGVQ